MAMEYRETSMPEDPVRPPSELRLALRRQLEDMFRSLDLVHDEIEVTSEAARSEGHTEIAKVLTYCVCSRLFGELKSLTNIIEWLGGRTALSEETAWAKETSQCGETIHAQ